MELSKYLNVNYAVHFSPSSSLLDHTMTALVSSAPPHSQFYSCILAWSQSMNPMLCSLHCSPGRTTYVVLAQTMRVAVCVVTVQTMKVSACVVTVQSIRVSACIVTVQTIRVSVYVCHGAVHKSECICLSRCRPWKWVCLLSLCSPWEWLCLFVTVQPMKMDVFVATVYRHDGLHRDNKHNHSHGLHRDTYTLILMSCSVTTCTLILMGCTVTNTYSHSHGLHQDNIRNLWIVRTSGCRSRIESLSVRWTPGRSWCSLGKWAWGWKVAA